MNLFYNDALSWVENLIIWINVLGAAVAEVFQAIAYRRGLPPIRVTHLLISVFAFIYVIAYIGLELFEIEFMVWSHVMRGVSIVVWFTVWIYPAIISIRSWKRLSDHIVESAMKNDER